MWPHQSPQSPHPDRKRGSITLPTEAGLGWAGLGLAGLAWSPVSRVATSSDITAVDTVSSCRGGDSGGGAVPSGPRRIL